MAAAWLCLISVIHQIKIYLSESLHETYWSVLHEWQPKLSFESPAIHQQLSSYDLAQPSQIQSLH